MLQLHVTDELGAVTCCIVEKFPFLIGRSPQADLRITFSGVWEEHASIRLAESEDGSQRFVIESVGQSILSINGEIASGQVLRVGDMLSLGAARLTVSLAPARQSKLAWHESTVWVLLSLVLLLEALVVVLAK